MEGTIPKVIRALQLLWSERKLSITAKVLQRSGSSTHEMVESAKPEEKLHMGTVSEVFEKISITKAKNLQTFLPEDICREW